MLSANEIRNVRCSKSMSGYKQEEVDILLDKIEADYEQFERTLREMNAKITQLKEEVEDYKSSQGNIQNILISAQKFADQIVEEAKSKSAEIISSAEQSIQKITVQERELTSAFDKKAGERKTALQYDIEKIISAAEEKKAAVEKATQSCIDRQQLLFDKMKIEIAAFKADVTNKYKEHLELLSNLPDTVPSDPAEIAAAVSMSFDNATDIKELLNKENNQQEAAVQEKAEEKEETSSDFAAKTSQTGFVISSDEFDLDAEDDEVSDLD